MALLYIMDHDSGGAVDRYRQYDIVEVVDDCPVNQPPARPYFILKVEGVTKAQVGRFLARHSDEVGRRLWKIDIAAIPLAWRQQFVADRYGEVTLAQARKYLLNKATGLHDDGS